MSNETRDSRQTVSSRAQGACHFIWPLSKSPNARRDEHVLRSAYRR